ncbi:MAG: hypothetical protein Q9221_003934 [Calogaya cf. arnoldii]
MDPLHSEAIHTERPISIVCIGAGASGLLLAYKLQRSFGQFELTVFEKNNGVSGTWLENRYPGCACDVPAHNYTYSFEPKHDWSRTYAGSREIRQYFETFKEKYRLGRFIRLGHLVTKAQWLDADDLWQVEVTNLEDSSSYRCTCHILINASGYLNTWAWPEIAGLSDFEGQLVHSAGWDDKIELQGKNVALIGNGVHEGVVEFTKQGCKSSGGTVYPVDVIVCATGFDTSFVPRFPIQGHDGINLQTVWKECPSSYLGIAAAGFPNYFMFLGPYSPVANGPTLAAIGKRQVYIHPLETKHCE